MLLRLAGIAIAATACAHAEHSSAHHAGDWLGGLVVAVAETAVDAAAQQAVDRVARGPDEAETPSRGVDMVPMALDRDFIAFSLDPVRPALARCGAVTIAVVVQPSGEIARLDAFFEEAEAPPDVQSCVASVLRDVRFVSTIRGGRFRFTIGA
jgi:hypothetical protein